MESKLVIELSNKAIKENKAIDVFYNIDYGLFIGCKSIVLDLNYAHWNYRDNFRFRRWGSKDITTIKHKDIIGIEIKQ